MKNLKLFYILPILFILSNLTAQSKFSLEEAVQYALANHTNTKLDAISIADAEQQMRLVKSSGLPQVTGSSEYQYFIEVPKMVLPKEFDPTGEGGTISFQQRNAFSAGVNASILAFDGTYLVALKASKYYRDFVASQTELTPITLRNAITQAYYAVLMADRNRDELNKNINVLQSIRNETNAIFTTGFAEKLDVDRLDLSINNLATSKDNLDRTISTLKNLLKYQMNYPQDQEIELSDSFEDLYNKAINRQDLATAQLNLNNRPEYRTMTKGIQLAHLDIERYQKGYLPTLALFGSFQRAFQSNNIFKSGGFWLPTSVAGASLSIPIFDGFGRDANIQKAKLSLEKSNIMKSEFERGVNLELKNAQSNYLNAVETAKSFEKSYRLAEEIYRVAQVKYKEGIGSSLEVRQAEADLYQTQASYLNAQYEVINAHFNLQKTHGVYN